MKKQNYEVNVLVNGQSVREYCKNNKIYIEGKNSSNYSIKIKNNGFKKILAIPTVDGLSILNGKEASHNSPGYIIEGYNSITIDGWRTSNDNIAKFYFTNPEDSYRRKIDKKNNLGIIGVVIFREKETVDNSIPYTIPYIPFPKCPTYPIYPDPYAPIFLHKDSTYTDIQSKTMNANMNLNCNDSFENLGTGFGESKRSVVETIDFEKENIYDAIFEIYYNTKKQLKKLGIDFHSKPEYISPQAFPNQFCKPPKK